MEKKCSHCGKSVVIEYLIDLNKNNPFANHVCHIHHVANDGNQAICLECAPDLIAAYKVHLKTKSSADVEE